MSRSGRQRVRFENEIVEIQTAVISGIECLRLKDVQRRFPSVTTLYINNVLQTYLLDEQGHDLEPLRIPVRPAHQIIEARGIERLSMKYSNDDQFKDLHKKLDYIQSITDRIDGNVQEVLNQIKYVMRQMYELHEYTTPRYFFIVPAKDHQIVGVTNWFQIHYKLYFLCECSSDPKELHVAPHEGYLIKKPTEFITRYGPYLKTTLSVVQVLLSIGGFAIPQLTKSPTTCENMKEMIGFVQNVLEISDGDLMVDKFKEHQQAPLQGADLRELESYLELIDDRRALGNLYRLVTKDGHVRWVCLEHYDTISYQNKLSEYISQWEIMGGQYDRENREATINEVKLNSTNAQIFSEALSKGFNILKLILTKCSIYEKDFEILLHIILNRSSLRSFEVNTLDIRNRIGITKYTCEYLKIELYHQSLQVRFCDYYHPGNSSVLSRILEQNTNHRILDLSISDFFQYEHELQRCLSGQKTISGLIIEHANNIDVFDVIFALKIQTLKLNYSLGLSSISSNFCDLIKKNQLLFEIDLLDESGFDDEAFLSKLFSALEKHKSIKQLNIHIQNLRTSSKKESCLMDALQNYTFIHRLCLSQSIISHKLVEIIRKNQSIVHLEFRACQISSIDMSLLKSMENNVIFSEQNSISMNLKWINDGKTVVGGNGVGIRSNQLYLPRSMIIDDERNIYIADTFNHRIVKWKKNGNVGEVVAGGNGPGNQNDQLSLPTKVVIDKKNNALIIADHGNQRIVRWSCEPKCTTGETIISNITCWDLVLDEKGYLYTSDWDKHAVIRWNLANKNAIVVAGGNKKGDRLNQLNRPYYIFIDKNDSVYVSDFRNERVMKWLKGAKEGLLVAGGDGQGCTLKQLSSPSGILVDQSGALYIADSNNNRIMCWLPGARTGTIVIGEKDTNQLNLPCYLTLDRQNNLYIVDHNNHRIQKYCFNHMT